MKLNWLNIHFTIIIVLSLIILPVSAVFSFSPTKDVSRNNYYPTDGLYGYLPSGGHYYVYRTNTSAPGYANFTYQANSTTINVTLTNIERIDVDMFSLFENHSSDVWVENLTYNFMQSWWIKNGAYQMNIEAVGLQEFRILDIGVDPVLITLNDTSIDFDSSGDDITVNLTGYNLTAGSVIKVYFEGDISWINPLMLELIKIIIIVLAFWWILRIVKKHVLDESDKAM